GETRETPWRLVGEVLRTYIICEDGDKNVWLIDKHAAHERVQFDRLKNNPVPVMRQTLLRSLPAELPREDAALLLENLSLLEGLGFLCEEFGADALLVREIPADILAEDAVSALEELAQTLRRGGDPAVRRDAMLATMACKAAIKAGMLSSGAELRILIDRVQAGEIRYCPHGRPVAVKIPPYELEKLFKRA
ncbi:MAG: DNA mismatch repair protein MutL, partial [Oscillospiraceae bacterium]